MPGDPQEDIAAAQIPDRFNPRPASMPGDPRIADRWQRLRLVSIRARHQCRAIRPCRGRYDQAAHVSIRARHQCRAIPCLCLVAAQQHRFQSAPGINAGRSGEPQAGLLGLVSFNPRPASMPGDPELEPDMAHAYGVSIRARHQCRAIPGIQSAWADAGQFQSAPGINAGRSRAYRPGRAHPPCFNPRPASMPGDPCSDSRGKCTPRCFNPRPASMPGDPHVGDAIAHVTAGFNPRPASMPGDPLRCQQVLSKSIFSAFARTSFLHKISAVNLHRAILKNHLNHWLA